MTSHSPFLSLPASIAGAAPDDGVPAHYGAPLREQRNFARGRAIVDASHFGVVEISGEDRLSWIDSLTTQAVANLHAGDSAENLLLSPQGRIEYAFGIVEDGASAWLIVENGLGAEVAAWFHKMRFMMKVKVTDRSDEVFAMATLGDHDLGAMAPNGTPLVWHDPWSTGVEGATSYAAVAADAHPGIEFPLSLHLVDAAGRDALVRRVREGELEVAGTMSLEALRVAAWRPRQALEFDDRVLPHELDLLRSAVHLNKGCYRGQETVAKVHNLGRPPRRLVRLDLDGTDGRLPAPGALIYLAAQPDGRPVGRITTAVLHHEEGPIALAMLKRNTDPTAALLVDLNVQTPPVAGAETTQTTESSVEPERIDAAQTVIVSPDSGQNVTIPRGLRR